MMRKRIGEYLMEKGMVTPVQIEEILAHAKSSGLRFGDAAIALKVVTREQLISLFGPNYEVDFFSLEQDSFPSETRELFHPDFMIRYGVVPLGFFIDKNWFRAQRALNLGFINPARQDSLKAATDAAHAKLGDKGFTSIKTYLVLGEQFLQVMMTIYGVTEAELDQKDVLSIDPTLSLFVGS